MVSICTFSVLGAGDGGDEPRTLPECSELGGMLYCLCVGLRSSGGEVDTVEQVPFRVGCCMDNKLIPDIPTSKPCVFKMLPALVLHIIVEKRFTVSEIV